MKYLILFAMVMGCKAGGGRGQEFTYVCTPSQTIKLAEQSKECAGRVGSSLYQRYYLECIEELKQYHCNKVKGR